MTIATEGSVQQQSPPKRRERSDIRSGLLMGAPAFILLLVFLIGPFFSGAVLSFTDQRLISANPTEFVGLRNYQRLLSLSVLTLDPIADETSGERLLDEEGNLQFPRSREFTRDEENYPQYQGMTEWFSFTIGEKRYVVLAGDPVFMRSMVNTLLFALIVIPLQTGLGLLLAILVNQGLKGTTFFRTAFFSPVVTSMVVVSIVWTFLYDKDVGLINEFLSTISGGLIPPLDWLGSPETAMLAIIIMSVWQGVGFQMVLFLAGLQGVPEVLYEAASIDGANAWNKFRNVTLPGIRNVFIFIFITITIAAFQLFTQPFVMTNGGPDNATTTVTFYMVRKGFREQDIAYASAISVIFFFFILGISLLQRHLTREPEAT